MQAQHIIDAITTQGMLPLYFNADSVISCNVAKALYAAGIRVIEYTNRGREALQNFKDLIALRNAEMPGLLLGIGTIKTVDDATKYLDAEADFIICPVTIPEVAKAVHARNHIWIPGCMSVTDIAIAEAHGATFVKLFPGNVLGPGFMSSIKDLFPNLKFMPTGGVDVTAESMGAWFKAGVKAVGMGSKLITTKMLEEKDYAGITAATVKALELLRTFV